MCRDSNGRYLRGRYVRNKEGRISMSCVSRAECRNKHARKIQYPKRMCGPFQKSQLHPQLSTKAWIAVDGGVGDWKRKGSKSEKGSKRVQSDRVDSFIGGVHHIF